MCLTLRKHRHGLSQLWGRPRDDNRRKHRGAAQKKCIALGMHWKSRARGIAPAEPDVIAEVADRSGHAAKVMTGSNKPSIRGLDDSSDDGCVVSELS